MANEQRIQSLEQEINQLEVDKLELIRSTSTEIERLRLIIRTLTDPHAKHIDLNAIAYKPLSAQEKDKLLSSLPPHIIPPKDEHPSDPTNTDLTMNAPRNGLGSLREEKSYEYKMKVHDKMPTSNTDDDEHERKTHRKEDSIFRLNSQRLSYKGFEFGDFGFLTTDFDQLSRGHTQWINQVMYHPVQNGIVVSASDDWCIMFWRCKITNDGLKQEKLTSFRRSQKVKSDDAGGGGGSNYYIDPKQQPIVGEIDLLPVLKINTGLEVKAIAMSSDGTILAATCYDEEEDDGCPELQLYFDEEQNWTFKTHQFDPYHTDKESSNAASLQHSKKNDNGRTLTRRIVPLPFEPLAHCLSFTRNNQYVFVGMQSSVVILQELNEEWEEEYGGAGDDDGGGDDGGAPQPKYLDHPCSLCCVHVHSQKVNECDKLRPFLKDDEYVLCITISPNGARIAIGTNMGQLIVTGVVNLTGEYTDGDDDEDDYNPLLLKIWSSNQEKLLLQSQQQNSNSNNNDTGDDSDGHGAINAIEWSNDNEWIVCGHASGAIQIWKKNTERRLSTQLNKTIKHWMGAARIKRKNTMFSCKYVVDGIHVEGINGISLKGSLMVSGADDGNVVIHDLSETFIDALENSDNSPMTLGRVEKIHAGRMVNSVCLSSNCSEENLLVPLAGLFMVTSGADNIVHCVSLMEVCRDTIRNQYLKQRNNALQNENEND